MEWSDSAIVLSTRPHGENGVIVELLTQLHGRHLGLVRGGSSRRIRPTLQPGNTLDVQWRGRLAEHLGSYTAELSTARAGALMEGRDSLKGLNAFVALCGAALPERQPYPPVFVVGEILLDAMVASDASHWLPLFARWEAGLLEALGFGLDLSEWHLCRPAGQAAALPGRCRVRSHDCGNLRSAAHDRAFPAGTGVGAAGRGPAQRADSP